MSKAFSKGGFCPLASGSKGNCLFLSSGRTNLLIDAGLSLKATLARLNQINVSMEEIHAIVVTHDHTDHIHGVRLIAERYGIPVLANSETAKGILNYSGVKLPFKIFATGETFEFGDIEVHPFTIQHDTVDPVAFTFKTNNLKIGVCADLGFVTSLVRAHLKDCDHLYIEANHEPSYVHASSRPMVYKQRVLGRSGHLSNQECGELLADVAHKGLKSVYLAHLSSECNSHDKAKEVVSNTLAQRGIELNISVAPQETIGEVLAFE